MGLDPEINRKQIIAFIQRTNVVKNISHRQLNECVKDAKKITKTDFHSNAWLTEKVHNAMIKDYKEIWEQQEDVITNLRNQSQWMLKHAKRIARDVHGGDQKRFYEYMDHDRFRLANVAHQEALMKKLEMMKAGFIQFRIQRYIEALQGKRTVTELKDIEQDPIIQAINKSPLALVGKEEKQTQIDTKQENNRFELAEHLKPFEEKFNRKLSSLEE